MGTDISLDVKLRYEKSPTYLALDPGLNSGAVGFKVLFDGEPLD